MTQFYSAWEARTNSVYQWLEALLENNEVDGQDVVWAGSDGSYAVGYLDSDDIDAEDMDKYTEAGSVTEFLTDAEPRRQAAAVLGSRGGTVTTNAKAAAARENGKRGGRPRKS